MDCTSLIPGKSFQAAYRVQGEKTEKKPNGFPELERKELIVQEEQRDQSMQDSWWSESREQQREPWSLTDFSSRVFSRVLILEHAYEEINQG